MVAETVYIVAKALPEKELQKLYMMLSREMHPRKLQRKAQKAQLISDEEAMHYIFKTVFCKSRK